MVIQWFGYAESWIIIKIAAVYWISGYCGILLGGY